MSLSSQQQQVSRSLSATVTGAVNNGSGLIRLSVSPQGPRLFRTGNRVLVANVGGVAAASGTWTVTAVGGSAIDLQGSTFSGTYTSGGTVKRVG